MNKLQEKERWRKMLQSLPKGGYTHAWLHDQLPFIETAIEGDLLPQMRALTMSETLGEKERIIKEAEAKAARIIERAEELSRACKNNTTSFNDSLKQDCREFLRKTADRIV